MKYEQAIRLRHQFNKEAGCFLRTLAGLTNQEVELALGRIADRSLDPGDEPAAAEVDVLERVMAHYFALRLSGGVRHSGSGRRKLEKQLAHDAAVSRARDERRLAMELWEGAVRAHEVVVSEWEENRRGRSWIHRWFRLGHPPPPARPKEMGTYIAEHLLRINYYSSQIPELLIEYAASFALPIFPGVCDDLSGPDIQLLLD